MIVFIISNDIYFIKRRGVTMKSDNYTIADIYALPEGKRAELIDGRIYDMAPPNRIHQKLVSQFTTILGHHIEKTTVPARSILPHLRCF